jgi:hypothetical protein
MRQLSVQPKTEVQALLDILPDDYSLEAVRYHPYAAEKIGRGIARAGTAPVLTQDDAETTFSTWTSR